MRYIVVDLEMHPLPNKYKYEKNICKNEVIEIGAVALDEQMNEIGEFKKYVKPFYTKEIQPSIAKLTGITTSMLQDQDGFEQAFTEFASWCNSFGEEVQIMEWSENDFLQMIHEICLKRMKLDEDQKKLMIKWKDYQKEYSHMIDKKCALSLDTAMLYASIEFHGDRHDALWDARNTADLYRVSRTKEQRDKIKERAATMFKSEPLTSSLGDLFNFGDLLVG